MSELDPELADLVRFVAEARPRQAATVEEARRSFRTLTVDLRDPATLPVVASVDETTVPGGDGPRPARLYRPRLDGPLPTVVFFHGGGFVVGDLDTHEATARSLAADCAAVVLSVDYRLAPEHPFPAAVDDAVAATSWARDHLDQLGGGPRLAVAGDSAGGNLAAVVAQEFRDRGRILAGQLLLYPVVDFGGDYPSREENATGYLSDEATTAWWRAQYSGALTPEAARDPRLSPIHGALTGLAPAVVATAQFDALRDEGRAYADALRAAGVPVRDRTYAGMIHGFAGMDRFSAGAQAAFASTCADFRALLHGS